MPDFNSQRPQEPNTLNDRLRTLILANWVRIVLISLGLFFFVMVVVPGGLLIYQYSGIGDKQQADQERADQERADQQQAVGSEETVTCDERYLSQAGQCFLPRLPKYSVVCGGKSRDLVIPADRQGGDCLDAGELHRADCGGGGVWVYETQQCIPDAETIMCEEETIGSASPGPCDPTDDSLNAEVCYRYYVFNAYGRCVERDSRDVHFPR
jgi:hypothetical protein